MILWKLGYIMDAILSSKIGTGSNGGVRIYL
jgi:hypothetical protein